MKRIRNGMILPVILLLLWYIITRMQVFSPYLLPSPGMVWEALTELATSGELAKHLSISLRRVFFGFLLAACTAIPLGILCGRSRYFYTYCWFLLEFLLVFAGILTACAASGRHSFNHFVGRH